MEKGSTEWTEDDLLELIKQAVEESPTLDYKGAASLRNTDHNKNEISKDVSAFANSAGGIIVYGVKEDDKRFPTALDPIDPEGVTKEWLGQVIRTRIQPPIRDIHINPISLSGSNKGNIAYVVSIPQSTTAHQASNNKYYKRSHFESVPMEDYEVRDVMNRLKYPRLTPKFYTANHEAVPATGVLTFNVLIAIANDGAMAAHWWKLVMWTPAPITMKSEELHRWPIRMASTVYGNEWCKLSTPNMNRVIFPDDEWDLSSEGLSRFSCKLYREHDRDETEPFLLWKTYADHMPPQRGSLSLAELRLSTK